MAPGGGTQGEGLPLLALAGLCVMVAMRMCDAMLPALAASFNISSVEASPAISSFAVAYGVMQLLSGPLGDRYGKPRIITLATLACAMSAFGAAMAQDLSWLIFARAVMGGTAAAVIPLTMAWVGDEIPLPRRQALLAKLLTFVVFGMMTGAWAGGALTEAFGWRWVFAAEGAALLAAAAAILFRGPRNRSDRTLQAGSQLKNAGAILRNSTARRIYAVVLFEGALVFGVLAFVPSLLHERFKLPLTESGAILAAFGLGGFGATWMLGRTRLPLLACAGAGLLCIAFVTLSLMPHWGWSLPACLLAGLGFYLLHGTLQTCATQISTSARGTAVSMFSCAIFLGQSAGVAGMGIAITNGLADQCIAMAAAILLALGLHFAYWLRLNPLGRGDAR